MAASGAREARRWISHTIASVGSIGGNFATPAMRADNQPSHMNLITTIWQLETAKSATTRFTINPNAVLAFLCALAKLVSILSVEWQMFSTSEATQVHSLKFHVWERLPASFSELLKFKSLSCIRRNTE